MILEEHLKRQIAFSKATFGPGARQKGVIDHIEKELDEIKDSGFNDSNEWVDVVLLGLDGLWRSIAAANPLWTTDQIAVYVVDLLIFKQNKNEDRVWPDWRTAAPDVAIEHVR